MYRSLFYGFVFTLLLVSLTVLYILKKTFTKDFFSVLLLLEKRYVLLSLLSVFLYHTFDNIRLFVLSRAMGLKYSFLYGYVISFINTFGATITPAHVGGEFMSFYTLMRKGGRLHKVMGVVTMKTLTGSSFFLLAFPLMVYNLYKNPRQALDLLVLIAVVLLIFGGGYLLLRLFLKKNTSNSPFWLKVKYTIKRYIIITRLFLRSKKVYIGLALLSSLLLYLSFLAIGAFLLKAFEEGVGFFKGMFVQLALLYAIFVSPTPGGSGVGELGGLSVFALFLEPHLLGLFVILWRFISQYLSAIIGGVLLSMLIFIDARRYKNP